MTDFEFQVDNFMLFCSSKNLSRKTMASYEQALKLFGHYLKQHFKIEEVTKVQTGHIRQYIKFLRERGKYSVVSAEESKKVNHPERRVDFKKEISTTTIANYVRNIKVFFNYLYDVPAQLLYFQYIFEPYIFYRLHINDYLALHKLETLNNFFVT
ncbi:site-specific integrase [Paenibacillus sp. FSL F4-0125]|uniref:site-specific integrase n=1 Tax=Paenibacillus sp. FSL F4-0125 TaxID=2954730 RepID=UPI0030FAF4E3